MVQTNLSRISSALFLFVSGFSMLIITKLSIDSKKKPKLVGTIREPLYCKYGAPRGSDIYLFCENKNPGQLQVLLRSSVLCHNQPSTHQCSRQFDYLSNKWVYLGVELTSCGMYIPLSDDKHRFVRDNSKKCTGNPRKIESKKKKCGKKFYWKKNVWKKKKFSDFVSD